MIQQTINSKTDWLHFVGCLEQSEDLSSAAASLVHCKGRRAAGKLEVKAEAAADAGRESNTTVSKRERKIKSAKKKKLEMWMQTLMRPSQMSLKWGEMILIMLIELSHGHVSFQKGLKYIYKLCLVHTEMC